MFTGLIEAVCTVKSVRRTGETMRLAVDLGPLADQTGIGDSIAINGVCLTAAALDGSIAEFDISGETLAKSALGKLRPPSPVNVERALKATDRLGGHFVQGHIDGTATIKTIEKNSQFASIRFKTAPELLEHIILKGSVAVDGISLTVAGLDNESFNVTIIPQTLAKTTLSTAKIGDMVNIETDIIIKTINKRLEKILPQTQSLTVEKLKELGF